VRDAQDSSPRTAESNWDDFSAWFSESLTNLTAEPDIPLGTNREEPRIHFQDKKGRKMAYVVTAPCFGCKYTDCVVVCPMDCFHEGEQMLYIDPEECIDCDACRTECPVEAIFHEDNVPSQWRTFIQLNAEMASKTPAIVEKKAPLAGN
jgi:ferredoxin